MRPTIGAVIAALAATLAAAMGMASPAAAQDYPNRPITLVIPLPPGGTNDMMARAVADKLSAALGAEPMPTTPEEHAAVIDREETKWAAVIKSIGLKTQ